MSKINKITPIKDGMSKKEAEDAIKSFLSEILSSDKLVKREDISNNKIISDESGFRNFQVIELTDGSSWVVGNHGIERIIGASYLKITLQELKLNGWEAVETKFCLKNESDGYITCQIKKSDNKPLDGIPAIISDDIITFSKYAGSTKPEINLFSAKAQEKRDITNHTGYSDFMCSANLRLQDDGETIIIIDTEYGSFKNNNGQLLSKESEELLGESEFSFPVVNILGEDVFNNDGIET